MAQFRVYANANAGSRRLVPYLLDIQSELINVVGSRVVVPLITPERASIVASRLMPVLDVAGRRVVMDTAQLASVPSHAIGKEVADLQHERYTILNAVDFLLSGC